jgi:hypothetical protein
MKIFLKIEYLKNCVRSWKVQVVCFVMEFIHYGHPQVNVCRDVFPEVDKMSKLVKIF